MSSATDSPWWVRYRPSASPRARLFCFPYAGGSAGLFRPWPMKLPPTVEVVGLQLPGRENRLRESPPTDLAGTIEPMTAGLLPLLDRPCCFFGYSLGGLMAFEVARRLRGLNAAGPRRLIVAASEAPQCEHARNPPIHRRSDDEFVAELRRFGGTPEAVFKSSELLQAILPMLRADFQMLETYQYVEESLLDVPIAALGGLTDDEVTPDRLAGWSDQTRGGFTMQFFPGDHFFLKTSLEPLLAAVVREIESATSTN